MRSLAIARLSSLTTSVDKIKLARDYHVDSWLQDAYMDVCLQPELPCESDLVEIGFDLFRKIARAREALRSSELLLFPDEGRCAIIQDIFKLDANGM
jgi:hypothetical protein